MNALLERILNIIANDAFPDEDKPYIIREIVAAWNEAKDQIPHTLNQDYGDGYKDGYEQAKDNIGTLQQRELDEKWDSGYLKGVSDAEAKDQIPGANGTWYDEKYVDKLGDDKYKEGFGAGEKVKHAQLFEELYAAVSTITNQQFKNNGSLATIAGHNIYLKQHMDDAYDKGVKDGMREGFKSGVHTSDTRHKEELDKISNDKWLEGYNQAKEEYAAEVLKLAYKHEQELEVKWREGYNEGRSEPNPTAIHSAEYLKFCEDKAYKKGYQQGYTENGDYFYNNGYADGLAQSKQEFHRHAAERYRAGVQDGRNEIVNTINNLRTPE